MIPDRDFGRPATDAVVGAARAVAGTKVGRAVATADRVAGHKAGEVAGKVIDWKQRQAVRFQSAMAEEKLGKAMAWAAGTKVGRRTTLVRAAAEWIARRVRGPSGVLVRQAEQAIATRVPVPDVLTPVPRATFSEGGPPTMEDVAGEIGQRLWELGVEVPPAEELFRAVEAVFETLVTG